LLQVSPPKPTYCFLLPHTCHIPRPSLPLDLIIIILGYGAVYTLWRSPIIPTRYGLDGPGFESRWRQKFSAPVQTGPGAHQASCTMGIRPISRGKAVGGWLSLPTPSDVEVKENVDLYLYSSSGASQSVIGRTLSFTSLCTFLQFPSTVPLPF
jgi:hypothetical protein